jgi:hypothetical protein|tara:strand:+ start:590 stop:868 length:279 start_codon:yes stop_codon:yes gene_type:complete
MSTNGYVVLWRVELSAEHVPTGETTHYRGGEVLPPPHSLQIAQYPDDNGYYLFYLDKNGTELTDTYHDDVASAMAQAEWEFEVKADEWEKLD